MLLALGHTIGGFARAQPPRAFGLGAARLLIAFGVSVGVSEASESRAWRRACWCCRASMPAAVFTYLFAARYERDADDIAGIVLISTLLAALMLPFVRVVCAVARGQLSQATRHAASRIAVTPMPPAVHTEIKPRPRPRCCKSFASAPTSRVPVAANGWPTATLPPFTLSFARSIDPIARSRPSLSRQNFLRLPRLERHERLRRESLVNLVELEILEIQLRVLEHRGHRIRRGHQQSLAVHEIYGSLARVREIRRDRQAARSAAQASEHSSTAEAPSVNGVLLPAVSVPFGPRSNTGFSFPSCSRLVSARRLLSRNAARKRDHQVLVETFRVRFDGVLVARERELVLLPARELPLLRRDLHALAHRQIRARLDHARHHRLQVARPQAQPWLQPLPKDRPRALSSSS